MSGIHSRESSRDTYMDIGGRTNQEIESSRDRERLRTNIGYMRLKMLGTNFPDKVEESREAISPTRAIYGLERPAD